MQKLDTKNKNVNVSRHKKVLYNHLDIEKKWQGEWFRQNIYSPLNIREVRNKFYNLWMFPYPSAEGLHAGHAFASTGSDIYGRFMRMNSKTVFQPIGYDSFGIHAENYALKIHEDPHTVVKRTTKHYEEQMRALGHGYDWHKTVTTSDADYYKWTQWLFLKMWQKGLAYKKKAMVNFCPSCKTVLADEQVMTPAQAGKEPLNNKGKKITNSQNNAELRICERCGTVVDKKELQQWFFAITSYANRLLKDLAKINWSERVVIAQRNWIGKKEGINITYPVKNKKATITCFTTRPDTNFGATFVVVAPEYVQENLLALIPSSKKKNVSNYIKNSLSKSDQQRKEEGKQKSGVFTGLYAVNKLNNYEMPIWVSDFVLMDVGTGAVVGVPGHDQRDFEFAQRFSLPIIRVVVGPDGDKSSIKNIDQVQEDAGKMINSDFLNGLDIHEATSKIMDYLEQKKWGKKKTIYHLRDWLISRQRYWGAPIPMVNCSKCGWQPVPEKDLPVLLPTISDYQPKGAGKGPLANHKEFYQVPCPKCASPAERETDVMDTFVDSAWYFLRYPSVGLDKVAFDPEITKKWLPVDLYFGGAEHSVLHLMYARFVTKVFHDLKLIDFDEPFTRFFAHGLMIKDGAKMSKSRGNVVNPDDYIKKFGADTLRLYLVFMGPMDGYPDFRDTGIEGMERFVNRLWQLFNSKPDPSTTTKVTIKLHQTIKGLTENIKEFKYNTAIAKLMELVNVITNEHKVDRPTLLALCQLLAPFTPHLAEEVWVNCLAQPFSIHRSIWPSFNSKLAKEATIVLAVQVNGKVRSQIKLSNDDSKNKANALKLAESDPKIKKWLQNKKIKTKIFIPRRIINFVTYE